MVYLLFFICYCKNLINQSLVFKFFHLQVQIHGFLFVIKKGSDYNFNYLKHMFWVGIELL